MLTHNKEMGSEMSSKLESLTKDLKAIDWTNVAVAVASVGKALNEPGLRFMKERFINVPIDVESCGALSYVDQEGYDFIHNPTGLKVEAKSWENMFKTYKNKGPKKGTTICSAKLKNSHGTKYDWARWEKERKFDVLLFIRSTQPFTIGIICWEDIKEEDLAFLDDGVTITVDASRVTIVNDNTYLNPLAPKSDDEEDLKAYLNKMVANYYENAVKSYNANKK